LAVVAFTTVAALAPAAFAVVAVTVAAFADAALAAVVARRARVAGDDSAAAVRAAEPVREVVDRVFPERGVGTLSGAFSFAVLTDVRGFPWAGAGVLRVPLAGAGPSARRRSWWSELMHLTSVGGHCSARSRGEERCPCKHVVIDS
jgi:hypothetical protein